MKGDRGGRDSAASQVPTGVSRLHSPGASSSGSRAPFRIFLPALPLRLQHPRIPLAPAGSARSIFTSWDARGHAPSSLLLAMIHASHSLIGTGPRSPCKSCCSRRCVDWPARAESESLGSGFHWPRDLDVKMTRGGFCAE